MRPIDKGGAPASYPYHITGHNDLLLAQSLNAAQTWPFTQQAVRALYNTQNPLTPWGALLALLVIALGQPPQYPPQFPPPVPPPLNRARKAKAALNYRVSKEYQKAAAPLGDKIGKFCCYCDQALPGQIAVEHVLPKAPYPLTGIVWENFLLACEVCNSNKGDIPSRDEMNDWGLPVGEEVQRYAAMRQYYLWPDTGNGVFTEYRPLLYYHQTANDEWKLVPDGSRLGGNLVSAVLSTRTVNAFLPNGLAPIEVRVTLKPTVAYSAAQHSEHLLGLWKDGTEQGGGKISDARMFNRTLAWFRVQKILMPVMTAAKNGDENDFKVLWEGVLAAAPAIGFFSVWLQLLELMNAKTVNVPNTQEKVWDYFLTQTSTSPGCFPSTATDRL